MSNMTQKLKITSPNRNRYLASGRILSKTHSQSLIFSPPLSFSLSISLSPISLSFPHHPSLSLPLYLPLSLNQNTYLA